MVQYQTRRETGELRVFGSLKEALEDAEDTDVYKISFSIGARRARFVRESDGKFHLRPIIAIDDCDANIGFLSLLEMFKDDNPAKDEAREDVVAHMMECEGCNYFLTRLLRTILKHKVFVCEDMAKVHLDVNNRKALTGKADLGLEVN